MPLPFDSLEIPAAADFHVHLRDGDMSVAVVPTIRKGGVNQVYVMPNLVPPVTNVQMALDYKSRLQAQDSSIDYLMTRYVEHHAMTEIPEADIFQYVLPRIYLHESITPEVVREAKKAGIVGIKSYPAGVTTNSSSGVISYEPFYPVFKAMEEEGLVLNLHGECPSDHQQGITILNAEASFLPTLKSIHEKFPNLKIVLEHCTTKDAVEAVRSCGNTVVGTITSHHLYILIDDAISDVYCYCKPVAKLPHDRRALLDAVVNSKGKFFLGTDSAPHNNSAKKGKGSTPAGVFTQPYATQLVLTALDEATDRGDVVAETVTPDAVQGFLSDHGRAFYGVRDSKNERIALRRSGEVIDESVKGTGSNAIEVVNFRQGKPTWSVEWK